MPAVGNLAGGYRDPMDAALAEVRLAVAAAQRAGAPRSEVLRQVANGLTGQINGPRERLLTKALADAAELANMTQDEARAMEATPGGLEDWLEGRRVR